MDLVTTGMLALFGSAAVGGLVGWLVGRFSSFAAGLGIGLLITGSVTLTFAARCLLEYREFSAPGPTRVSGEVIEIEGRPVNASGSITQPVPVVRFTAADGSDHVVRGPGAGGLKVGDRVTVIHDPADPQRTRVGQESQFRGGAIAFMLFGTFPFTVGLWFLLSALLERRAARARPPAQPEPARGQEAPSFRPRVAQWLTIAFNLLMVIGIFWTGLGPGTLQQTLAVGFGIVAAGMWGHGINGLLLGSRADPGWRFGMFVLGANFFAWALALWVLG